jgi:hypothetical protein
MVTMVKRFGRMLRYTSATKIENIRKLMITGLPFWIKWYRPIQFQFILRSTFFLDMTPCSPAEVPWRFGGTYFLHAHGRWISQASSKQKESTKKRNGLALLAWLPLRPWRWRHYIAPKRQWTSSWLHVISSKKTVLFIFVAVTTSRPTVHAVCKLYIAVTVREL